MVHFSHWSTTRSKWLPVTSVLEDQMWRTPIRDWTGGLYQVWKSMFWSLLPLFVVSCSLPCCCVTKILQVLSDTVRHQVPLVVFIPLVEKHCSRAKGVFRNELLENNTSSKQDFYTHWFLYLSVAYHMLPYWHNSIGDLHPCALWGLLR